MRAWSRPLATLGFLCAFTLAPAGRHRGMETAFFSPAAALYAYLFFLFTLTSRLQTWRVSREQDEYEWWHQDSIHGEARLD
jgi:hypothetical protein